MLIFPIDSETYIEALQYAQHSAGEHTHFHNGWQKDEFKQFRRVLSGQMAQKYVVRLLRLNGVMVEEDQSEFTEPDAYDFKIKGLRFDVKSSSHHLMPMQVSLPAMRKKPDYFIFCRLTMDLKGIKVMGVVRANEVRQERFFVPRGAIIPNTELIQFFEQGSYFYTGEYKPLQEIIEWVSKSRQEHRQALHPAHS